MLVYCPTAQQYVAVAEETSVSEAFENDGGADANDHARPLRPAAQGKSMLPGLLVDIPTSWHAFADGHDAPLRKAVDALAGETRNCPVRVWL